MEPTTGGEVWLRSFKKECPNACMSKKEDPVHKAEWEEKVFPQEQPVHNPPTQSEEAESNTHLDDLASCCLEKTGKIEEVSQVSTHIYPPTLLIDDPASYFFEERDTIRLESFIFRIPNVPSPAAVYSREPSVTPEELGSFTNTKLLSLNFEPIPYECMVPVILTHAFSHLWKLAALNGDLVFTIKKKGGGREIAWR